MKTLTIIGRQWWNPTKGHHYQTATILVDGREVHKTERECTYGNGYEDTARAWLIANRYLPGTSKEAQYLFRWCESRRVTYYRECINVARKGDL